MLNILPKFELVSIMIYFRVLENVRRPSTTPSRSALRSFSSRMIAADSLATSTALFTEIPTSATWSDGASLMPSPINPTTCPLRFNKSMIRFFCAGDNRAKIGVSSRLRESASSGMVSSSLPVRIGSEAIPISAQTFRVTSSLSPVRIFRATPNAFNSRMVSRTEALGGSKKAR